MAEGAAARRGHILIGHTHWDHIQGFPFFAPLRAPGSEWDVYAPRGFGASLRDTLSGQMQYTYFPVSLDALGAKLRYHDLMEGVFAIDDVRVTAHYLNHTALTLGYRLEADGVAVVYATDHEPHSRAAATRDHVPASPWLPEHAGDRRHCEFVAGADLLIHDTQYLAEEYPSRAGWGHSTLEYVVDVGVAAGVKRLALFHHDPQRDDAAVERLLARGRRRAAECGSPVEIFAAAEGELIELAPAPAPARPEVPVARSALDTRAVGTRPVVLALDDAAFAARLRRAVEAEGMRAIEMTNSGSTAERALAERPELVILGRRIGAADGLAVCRAIRETRDAADLPVIIVADCAEPGEGSQAAGATDWLIAPFSNEYARTKLRAWLLRTCARWVRAPLPLNEAGRLRALRGLALLDTPAEERFDRITRLAARLFDVPIALVTLVDAERQWFKSKYGIAQAQTPRELAFCAHTILQEDALVVPDALRDDRVADNPLVAGEPRFRFYAGQALAAPDGSRVGTLCVIDHRPRDFGAEDMQVLRDLAALAERELTAPGSRAG